MIMNLGVDIISVKRVQSNMNADEYLYRLFSEKEIKEASRSNNIIIYFAERFAGKEAILKCILDVYDDFSWSDIAILTGDYGQPYVSFSPLFLKQMTKKGYRIASSQISLSGEDEYVIAVAQVQLEEI